MFVLQRADHQHFVDDVEGEHEAVRAMSFPGEASWIPAAMRPIGELASGEQAHLFVRGLTLAHRTRRYGSGGPPTISWQVTSRPHLLRAVLR